METNLTQECMKRYPVLFGEMIDSGECWYCGYNSITKEDMRNHLIVTNCVVNYTIEMIGE